jgi:2',3'-cyclic-nucleotide 2'-phosphodiesterase (5'-nucleotidase family)
MTRSKLASLVLSTFAAVAGTATFAGCGGEVDPAGPTGELQVALTNAPADVACVRITVAGSRTATRLFDTTSGASTTFTLARLPVGVVTVDGEAFTVTCAGLMTATVPAFVSEAAVKVRIDPLQVARVTLKLIRNGRLDVGVDFEEDPAILTFATFNASLNRNAPGDLVRDLSTPNNTQARVIAEIIQRANPDVVLINEFDYVASGEAVELFRRNYLEVGQNGAPPVKYPFHFVAPSNTGISSGFDLNNNGTVVTTPLSPGYGDDSLGFGNFPGQFAMVVYSKLPIDQANARTFQNFKWKDMPGARLPDDDSTPAPADFYSAAELAVFPLSSKSHWDVPVLWRGRTIHFLASHPTPPVFDGPEDRNGRRNFDEIRLFRDYITPGAGDYIYDDAGKRGGLPAGSLFVIAGDQNSDPLDGDSIPGAIQQLINHPLVIDPLPASLGAVEQSALQGRANATHRSDPKYDTADFADSAPGNLRADYVLPSIDFEVKLAEVFWPLSTDPLFPLVGVFPFPSSDHRLVSVTVAIKPLAAVDYTLQILHASDQESGAPAIDDAPRFSAVMSVLERRNANTLKLTNGDVWIPGVFFNAGSDPSLASVPAVGAPSLGRADVAILNAIGFHAASFGNHEFDSGPREISNILRPAGAWAGARFPYLSANLDFSRSTDLASLVVANDQSVVPGPMNVLAGKIAGSLVFDVGGKKIGVVGLTTPLLPAISSPLPVITLPPISDDFAALAAIAQARIDALRALGIDKIIVMAHMQQFSIELAELAPRLEGADIILAGGNHAVWSDADDVLYPGDVRVLEYPQWRLSKSGEIMAVLNVGANWRYVGRFLANFDSRGLLIAGRHEVANNGAYATDDTGVARLGAAGDVNPAVKAVADGVKSVIIAKDGNIFGKTQVYLNGLRVSVRTEETNLGNLTSDANLWLAQKTDPFTVVSLKNGGGIRDSIGTVGAGAVPTFEPPAANPLAGKLAGEVSQLDIENSLRFNNDLVLVTVTAAQLKELVEHGVAAVAPGATPGQFPQVGGIRFTYDPTRTAQVLAPGTRLVTTAGSRIQELTVVDGGGTVVDTVVSAGAVVGDPTRRLRLVTLGFLADGGDNYPFPRFATENTFYNRVALTGGAPGTGFTAAGREQFALAEYLKALFPVTGAGFSQSDTPVASDTRIKRL